MRINRPWYLASVSIATVDRNILILEEFNDMDDTSHSESTEALTLLLLMFLKLASTGLHVHTALDRSTSVYSHFAAFTMSICLIFQCS